MYLLRFDGFDVVGSSPEALVKVTGGGRCAPDRGHPLAGATPEEDAALAAELLADPKERAEHLMLVDLGRNDLGRVCAAGSVEVVDFMSVERFSHVMHLVTTVVERFSGQDAFDVLTACFPAGTLSGAPKPRAMELIEELEPTVAGSTAARRIPRLPWGPRHRDRDPDRMPPRRRRLRPGRCRHRRGLRPCHRGRRVPEQGDGRAARRGHGAGTLRPATCTGPGDVTPRREMTLALGLVVLGAAVVLVGAGRSGGTAPGVPVAPGAPSGTGAATGPRARRPRRGGRRCCSCGRWARTAARRGAARRGRRDGQRRSVTHPLGRRWSAAS